MRRTFKLGQSNEVVKSGQVYDLHNDYAPIAVVFDTQTNDLKLLFKRLSADKAGLRVALVFNEVDVLHINGNIGASGFSGLDEMEYKGADDDDYDWLATEAQSAVSDHMIFRFDGGATLRVHSATADIVEAQALAALE